MIEHRDRQGRPISFERWGELMRDDSYRRVAYDEVGPYEISTVWIGYGFGARPLVFETMVLDAADNCWHWATEEEALRGHEEVVTLVRATLVEEPPNGR